MSSHPRPDGLPVAEYGAPGPLRDRLVQAIDEGRKTATSSLADDYRAAGEPLPRVGERELVVDSAGRPVCVTRVTAVEVRRLADVPFEHVQREGEGHGDVATWRCQHERFWSDPVHRSGEVLATTDDTAVVCATFVVESRSARATPGR